MCNSNRMRNSTQSIENEMVGPGGLEPLTSSVSRKRSNQLSYGPITGKDKPFQFSKAITNATKR